MLKLCPTPVAVKLLGVAIVAAVVSAGCGTAGQPPAAPAQSTPAPQPGAGPTVLAVKIDNVDAARPATGVLDADQVYVEQVEGGLTRLLAIYTAPRPPVIGPVRSARITDLELLGQFGRPVLAFSGAAPPVLRQLDSASLVDASPANNPAAYFRDPSREAPHNLYLRPARLPAPSPDSSRLVEPTGPPAAGGQPTSEQHVQYAGASFDFRWSPSSQGWQVWMDNTMFTDTANGQLHAGTVVIQHVTSRAQGSVEDSAGKSAPVAQTVGTGQALVLRDGKAFAATWSRPTPGAPTTFTTTNGQPLPFAPGQTWILLQPTA